MSADTLAPVSADQLSGQDELFPDPTPADDAPRVAKPPKVAADPEAPFGWMVDAKSGERRPKKAPGRSAGKPAAKPAATAPPPNRAANRPRAVTGEPVKPVRSYAEKVAELVDTAWMLTAATPVVQGAVLGRDMREITIKVRAQGAILRDQKPSLVQGVAMMAEHAPMMRAGIDWLSSDDGPGWILPACFALMPFVGATMALWRGSVDAAAPLAQRTADDFAALARQMSLVSAAPDPAATSAVSG